MQQRLEEAEIRELLGRAEEIHQQEQQPIDLGERLQEIVRAAEETGVSRSAMLQALRERQAALETSLDPGSLVFAPTPDGKLYVAEIVEVDRGRAKVHMLSGGDADLAIEDLRPFAMLPGQKVKCPWPSWGMWTCTVLSYDRDNRKIRVSDGWTSQHSFHISDVYLEPPTPAEVPVPGRGLRARLALAVLSAGIALGGAGGALLTWLLMR